MNTIVIATGNKNKVREFAEITAEYGIKLITRDEAGVDPNYEVIEDKETFEENSFKKADEICRLCGLPTIADDSGLVVDALDGAPGVYSARFAGENKSYEDNNVKLLGLMRDVPYEKRTARFVSVITIVMPDGKKYVTKGVTEGHIAMEQRGKAGFGYDPLFIPEGYPTTYAELTAEEKNAISHRGKALAALREVLAEISNK